MILYYIILLAVVQGITEFLPISSSAHLILIHNAMDPDVVKNATNNRLMDIAVHIGTLLAVCVYSHKDIWGMIKGTFDLVRRKPFEESEDAQLMCYVLMASAPILVIGFAVYKLVDPAWFYDPHIIAFTTIIFGLLLGHADKIGKDTRTVEDITAKDALWIGFLQCLSIIPGVSRSGITMTTARYLGLSRTQAARFSLLLAIVATSAVGAAGVWDIIKEGNIILTYDALLAMVLSFISALIVIIIMMRFLKDYTFTPFVIYRVLLGIGLLIYLYLWPVV
jgi:undecaprenyl-diphosphatase